MITLWCWTLRSKLKMNHITLGCKTEVKSMMILMSSHIIGYMSWHIALQSLFLSFIMTDWVRQLSWAVVLQNQNWASFKITEYYSTKHLAIFSAILLLLKTKYLCTLLRKTKKTEHYCSVDILGQQNNWEAYRETGR